METLPASPNREPTVITIDPSSGRDTAAPRHGELLRHVDDGKVVAAVDSTDHAFDGPIALLQVDLAVPRIPSVSHDVEVGDEVGSRSLGGQTECRSRQPDSQDRCPVRPRPPQRCGACAPFFEVNDRSNRVAGRHGSGVLRTAHLLAIPGCFQVGGCRSGKRSIRGLVSPRQRRGRSRTRNRPVIVESTSRAYSASIWLYIRHTSAKGSRGAFRIAAHHLSVRPNVALDLIATVTPASLTD
jgi:hypothetical protein